MGTEAVRTLCSIESRAVAEEMPILTTMGNQESDLGQLVAGRIESLGRDHSSSSESSLLREDT